MRKSPPLTRSEVHQFAQTMKQLASEIGHSTGDVQQGCPQDLKTELHEAMQAARRFYSAMALLEFATQGGDDAESLQRYTVLSETY